MSKNGLKVGKSAKTSHRVTQEVVDAFGKVSGDYNPLHFDDVYARTTRFGRRIAHGTIVIGYLSGLMAATLPGPGTIYLEQHTEFKAPVYINDLVEVEVTVEEVKSNGIVRLSNKGMVGDRVVLQGYSIVLLS